MRSSRFSNVWFILLVCVFVFWSVPAESGMSWLNKVKNSAKNLQETAGEALELEEAGKKLWKGDNGTPVAPQADDAAPATPQAANPVLATPQAANPAPAAVSADDAKQKRIDARKKKKAEIKKKAAERKKLAKEKKLAKHKELVEIRRVRAEKQKKDQEKRAAAAKKEHDEHAAGHKAYEDKRQAEQAAKKAEENKKKAEREAFFDSYSGPRVLDYKSQSLLSVKFNPDEYKVKIDDSKALKHTGPGPDPYQGATFDQLRANNQNNANKTLWAVLRQQYPKAFKKIKTEFDRRRELPKLQKRLMEDASNVETTYRVISSINLPQYDFNRRGYTLSYQISQLGLILDKEKSGSIFMSMDPDSAEQFKKDCAVNSCKFYVETVYEIVSSRLMHMNTLQMITKIKSLRIYKEMSSAQGKEMILSGLLIEIPISKLKPNPSYVRSGGEPDNKDSMSITF